MAVITATSDFGYKDPSLAQLKARFAGKLAGVEWVDICHDVEPNNRMEAAYLLKSTYKDFPKGTVHLMLVKCIPSQFMDFLCVQANGHFFICADNGILPSIISTEDKITASRKIDVPETAMEDVFGIFSRAALHLLGGGSPSVLGPNFTTVQRLTLQQPIYNEMEITGTVIYIKRDGTCVTNLQKNYCDVVANGRSMKVNDRRGRSIGRIGLKKADLKAGNYIAYWDKTGHLCVSIFESGSDKVKGANELLGIRVGDWIKVELT